MGYDRRITAIGFGLHLDRKQLTYELLSIYALGLNAIHTECRMFIYQECSKLFIDLCIKDGTLTYEIENDLIMIITTILEGAPNAIDDIIQTIKNPVCIRVDDDSGFNRSDIVDIVKQQLAS